MALENEELQQAMEELRRAFGNLADATDGAADGTRKLTEAEKKLKSKIDLTMQGLGGVAKFGAAVGKGETDLKAFNGIIDTATGLMGSLAKTIPVFGDALADFAKGVGEAAKMAVDALDNTAKSFVEIGKVGGLTAKGMSGVREQFIRSGLSLQSFQKQVVENSQTLAKFRGLTGEGATEFATIVGKGLIVTIKVAGQAGPGTAGVV
jgi:methyl-accepting chemotaxis protein